VQINADKSCLDLALSSGNIVRFRDFAAVNHSPRDHRQSTRLIDDCPLSKSFIYLLTLVLGCLSCAGCQTTRWQTLDIPAPPSHVYHLENRNDWPDERNDSHSAYREDGQVLNVLDSEANGEENDYQQNPYLIRYQSSDDRPSSGIRSLLDRSRSRETDDDRPLQMPINEKKMLTMADLAKNQDARPIEPGQVVSEIIFNGNRRIPAHHLTRNMGTRPGRYFDPDRLQEDVDKLWRMPEISRINGPYIQNTPAGVQITIEVVERNLIQEVKFVGNRELTDRKLRKECGLEEGAPLDVYQIRSAKSRIEELYKSKGFPRTQVEVLEGGESADSSVIFLIHEDQKQRIWKSEFEGNSIASDARLRSLIESKPGILKLFGGLVKRDEIERDILTLTNYYRSLGFFNARIGREVQESNDGRWITIRFIIHEGPRYKVRNVMFWGNQVFESDQLVRLTKLKPDNDKMPEFNVAKMNADVVALRDLYGGQGYVFADVEAEPRFLEEPGMLDIVYKINEGKQYRVGDVNVYFEGNYGVTQREVVLNRLSLRPGDLIDVREIRNSERRLGAAQIFADPTVGAPGPKIVVRPPELKDLERHAQQGKQRY